MVQELLKLQSLRLGTRDSQGGTALLTSLAWKNSAITRALLTYDQAKDEVESSQLLSFVKGRTLLYLACCSDQVEMVKELLEFSPELQINRANKDAEGHTPLLAAVTKGDVALCRMLLEEYGADPDAPDADGSSPLHCAVADHDDEALLRALLDNRANPHLVDSFGLRPLDIAAAMNKNELIPLLLAAEASYAVEEASEPSPR